MKRGTEATALRQRASAHPTATAMDIHQYGRQLIAAGKPQEALAIFQLNYERFDGAWPTDFGLARGYAAIGEYDKALEHAKKAHKLAPDAANRDYLVGLMTKLAAGEDIN